MILHSYAALYFSALTILVGQQEGRLACKTWVWVHWWWWYDWSFACRRVLAVTSTCLCITSYCNKIQDGFALWYRLTHTVLETGC